MSPPLLCGTLDSPWPSSPPPTQTEIESLPDTIQDPVLLAEGSLSQSPLPSTPLLQVLPAILHNVLSPSVIYHFTTFCFHAFIIFDSILLLLFHQVLFFPFCPYFLFLFTSLSMPIPLSLSISVSLLLSVPVFLLLSVPVRGHTVTPVTMIVKRCSIYNIFDTRNCTE